MAQLLVKSKSWFASSALSTVPVDARVDTMCTPGAVMSGWYSELPGIPRDEKSASQAGRFWPVWSAQWTAEFVRSEEHTSELQSQSNLVCRLLLEKKNNAL